MTRLYNYWHRHGFLTLSFLLPVILLFIYGIMRHVFPFGGQTIMTVDLGQQYIDFFAYFRTTLLQHPSTFLYSFAKGLGGDMLGVWAYYLMSPFNLVVLLTPGKWLSFGVWLIVLLKTGCTSLSMAYYLKKTRLATGWWLPTFGIAFALSGFAIANQFNIMWLDALIWLPLIVLGIEQLFKPRHFWLYPISLAILLVVNYYMGYMVCLFVVAYFAWTLVCHHTTWRQTGRSILKFIGGSLGAGLLAAWLLLPTFYQLTQSKGQYTIQKIHWKLEYNPLKMLSKLIVGNFNFDQMPKGEPNIFVGSLVLILFLAYFFTKKIPLKDRLAALVVTGFLGLSLCFEPLDLLWHGMQFPVWYPYRFSYVISFWLIVLAVQRLHYQPRMNWPLLLWTFLLLISGIGYTAKHLKSFTALDNYQVYLSIGFLILASLAVLLIPRHFKLPVGCLILITVTLEMTANAYISLNQISYVSQKDYADYTVQLQKAIQTTPQKAAFQRIGKTFMRTKNDPMQADYFGGSHFNSMLEPSYPNFMGQIGEPAGDGFVADTNQTEFTDAFLSYRYYLNSQTVQATVPKTSYKPDLVDYTPIKKAGDIEIYHNPNALALGFAASNQILKHKKTADYPLIEQNNIAAELSGQTGVNQQLFNLEFFNTVTYQNVKQKPKLNETFLKIDSKKDGHVIYTFTPTTNDAYYLTLGSSLEKNAVRITINGQTVQQYDTFRDPVVVNLANHVKGQTQTLDFAFSKSEIWLQNINLYRLNTQNFQQTIQKLEANPLKIRHFSNRAITGTIKITKQKQVLMTTIPYSSGWQVKVDGQTVKPKKALKNFLAVPLKKGQHKIQFTYTPPYLKLGLLISGLTILASLIGHFGWRFYRHRRLF
ncbi:YfhO family protein [Latilactobacillus fuchuensis]|uniref:YfhO family protein n=1 Tax=Latilactobacillus fuchuensis TaxID=164393 RepID=UPI0020C749A3|nr:YfhO family protein [Latilactobacillus fuchuensis]